MRAVLASLGILALLGLAYFGWTWQRASPQRAAALGDPSESAGDATWWDPALGIEVGLFNPVGEPELDPDEAARLQSLGYLAGYEPPARRAGVLVHDPSRAQPGYNLYVSGDAPMARLMTMQGEVVHRWSVRLADVCPERGRLARENWFRRARLLPDGGLVVVFDYNALVKLDASSGVAWALCGAYHHDVQPAPDGTLLALSAEERSVRLESGERQQIVIDSLERLDADGRRLERIDLLEAFQGTESASLLRHVRQPDLFHTNSISFLEGGQLLLSLRNVNAIAALDLATKKIRWVLTDSWRAQHEALPVEDGGILLFDNLGRERRSRALVVDATSGEIRWRYPEEGDEDLYSPVCGSVQRLGNGNTLIVESTAGRALEVTPDHAVVWEFSSPHRVAGEDGELVALLGDLARIEPERVDPWLRR